MRKSKQLILKFVQKMLHNVRLIEFTNANINKELSIEGNWLQPALRFGRRQAESLLQCSDFGYLRAAWTKGAQWRVVFWFYRGRKYINKRSTFLSNSGDLLVNIIL